MNNHNNVRVPYKDKLLVGAISGFIGTLVVFPIDTLKTRVQAEKSKLGSSKQSVVQIARSIASEFGFRGFYKGIHINLLGAIPEKALKLSVNDLLREFFLDRNDNVITVTQAAFAGGLAGCAQVIATNPMELVKLNLQLNTKRPVNERIALLPFIKEQGIRGLYRGTCATLLRDAVFSAIIFPVYEHFKQDFNARHLFESSTATMFTSGFVSGGFSAWLVTPFDVIKTRLQEKGGIERYKNWRTCLKMIYTEEGVKAFFKGAAMRFGVIGLLYAVALLAFDKQKQYIINELSNH